MAIYNDIHVKPEWKIISTILRYTFLSFLFFTFFIRMMKLKVIDSEPYKSVYEIALSAIIIIYGLIIIAYWIKPSWFKIKAE